MIIVPVFDLHYIESRNSLIPQAESITMSIVGPSDGLMFWALEEWTNHHARVFSNTMQFLSMQKRLTCGMPREREMHHVA